MTPAETNSLKLPLWRLIAGWGVLAAMVLVLALLAPVYFENFELQQYMRSLARRADLQVTPDEALRTAILNRARELNLPLTAGDVAIRHESGTVRFDSKYAVQMDFTVYQVDLHFHPSAASR